ncbi:hypothetical protein THAOC_28276 [Thalassiosira oceanica]|uniref:Uncharacterized protein n=1 Tax=Thalassiosira oceanica TaxID=159749 RepID=K0RJJ0_THAOC|nr:hypothetical protein THAOC_28276 [Thalassiosira oceanica]|eukprot:EJK52444.1 hypothetical protein THAOC_28276 [Thalassiosira oceanica]
MFATDDDTSGALGCLEIKEPCRPKAFKHAFWRHHGKRNGEKSSTKVKEREKQARELDLRKRAERLMNRNSGLESLDSSSDSEDEAESEIDETRAGFLPALNSPGGESSSPSFSTLPKQRLHRPSALALPNINNGDYRQVPSAGPAVGPDKSPPRRRLNSKTVMKSLLPNNNRIRSREQKPSEGFAFSFLSEDVWDKG